MENGGMISIFYINIQCTSNKSQELSVFLKSKHFDILCVSKTHVQFGIILIKMENYNLLIFLDL